MKVPIVYRNTVGLCTSNLSALLTATCMYPFIISPFPDLDTRPPNVYDMAP